MNNIIQAYTPLYFLEYLRLPKVEGWLCFRGIAITRELRKCVILLGLLKSALGYVTPCAPFLQTSVAIGPLIIFVSGFLMTLLLKVLNRHVGRYVSVR
jgi:hypothetical protein